MNQKSLKITFLIIAILIIILVPFLIFTSAQPKQILQPQTKVITQTTQSQVTEKYTSKTIIKQPVIQKRVMKHYYYNYYSKYTPKYKKPKYPIYKSFKAPTKKTYTSPIRNYHKPENRPIKYYPIDL